MALPWYLVTSAFLFATVPAASNSTAQTQEAEGPQRCLEAETPLWCLAEEAGLGMARALTSGRLALGPGVYLSAGTSSQGLLAEPALDLDLSALASNEEGRGKKRRKYAYMMVALATLAAVILPFKLKAIALMAATALFVGKMALVLASIIGLKKLVSKQSEETTHVHYGHRSDPEAHYLAYEDQIPREEVRL